MISLYLTRNLLYFNPRVLAGGRDMIILRLVCLGRISIHASSREDATLKSISGECLIDISIHASSREDATQGNAQSSSGDQFQSTRPRGRTRRRLLIVAAVASISIHASSREDATTSQSKMINKTGFQSTRPRGRTRQTTEEYQLVES